jgi:DNA-binding transcriptional MerR regulator
MIQSQELEMKIGKLAKLAGVSVDTVRYYERRGLIGIPKRQPSGYRVYRHETVDRIHLARRLQALGLTLDEIVDALRAHDSGSATCESERWRLESVRDRLGVRLSELSALKDLLDATLNRCNNNDCVLQNLDPGPR